ncbi:GNAT family N-acetyltransferase [Sinorhizobium fredii]|uniref:GNAT family N-acetyltransferase n=1 Tax=Rhizobium fredii TaxID=380 RepID=A0A844AFV5_RHIFR|nr:GNAT family N-acetyltransferase [Sinorhizobium fredii]AWM26524.1 Acetyltransferase [Sinorhizobium fredii CCBAU 25509]MQW96111.1 GNAT family N-acetyltransferase [Sinorhizobium fredii]MQX11843.1 GNAT family N-acetyltransferase [Sinorhizobium fredii]GEC32076.1 N-acetyltransferase [Sinorhizobium fredii]GLS07823.1 N-acetyltransferase [Sinorhizobium fredii]
MTTQEIILEKMTPKHLDGALELSRQVQWPHRREDWELVQSISQGIVALEEERLVATIIMTPYGDDTATINMVIVDAAMRGRGLGRKMLEEALAEAGERTCYLVATQEGLPLYEKVGFAATGETVQHQGEPLPVEVPGHVTWSESGDHAHLVTLDRAAHGHDRSALMEILRKRAKFAVIRDAGEIQAFAAIRSFGRGLVIGPVVARNDSEARALIDFLLAHHQGRFVRIDTDVSTNLAGWLTGRGLDHAGCGITMRRSGAARKEGKPTYHRSYALVSQALG